jgi:GTP diphosphokinase / guanosine-3',5'-bis(diphosphate) 3'-diphosphatase
MTMTTFDQISLLLKALSFAARKHQHQRRKNAEASPYINHLITVADILWNVGEVYDLPTLAAAVLHDTLEDTATTPEELETAFGQQVRTIVEEVTDDKRLPKQVRKRLQVQHAMDASLEARCVKLADKISNVADMLETPPADWSLQRRRNYVVWAEEVVDQLRGTNARLEAYFDEVGRAIREQLFQ